MMLQWLQQYWGSIVILSVLALVVGAIAFCHFRAKKQGKSTCGCGCSHCAMKGACHPQAAANEQAEPQEKAGH